MKEILWIAGQNPERPSVVWIDDLFFPPGTYIDQTDGHNPPMTAEWICNYSENPAYEEDDPPHAHLLRIIKEFCVKKNYGFGVTNFQICGQTLADLVRNQSLFIIDQQNLFAEGSDSELAKEIYGWIFVNDKSLPKEHCRFLTRFSGQMNAYRRQARTRFELTWWPTYEDTLPFAESGFTLEHALEHWVNRLFLNDDNIIAEAVDFYSKPWVDEWPEKWPHGQEHDGRDLAPYKKSSQAG